MSDILEKAKEVLQSRIAGMDLSNSVKFVIDGIGSLRAEGNEVVESDDEADLTLSAPADVFEDLLNGDLNGASAFMSGKLKVDGDMGLAMKLGQLLG